MKRAHRHRAWLLALLTFLVSLPPACYVGILLIGHARLFPYVAVWVDRLVLIAAGLGLPLLMAYGVYRLVAGRKTDTGNEKPTPTRR